MKETLQQRCQREAREKYIWKPLEGGLRISENNFCTISPEDLNTLIANTLKQAAEEWQGITKNIQYSKPVGLPPQVSQGFQLGVDTILAALTDAQKLLLGEDNENV